MMTKKISIVGIAKSGTSALYSSIKTALPAPRRLLFEPATSAELTYVTADPDSNGLTKGMFSAFQRQNYDPSLFTHNVAIVRDPRDIIISSTLFRFNRLKVLNNKRKFKELVVLFEKKENNPTSISVHDILEALESGEAQRFRKSLKELLQDYSSYIDGTEHHVITFDQMVSGDFEALNAYLGLTLVPPPPLEGWVSKISRKGTSGDWKSWFTPADVAFFREAMDPFIQKFGFDPEWFLEPVPVIEPQYCSEYIQRLSKARKVDPNLKNDVGSDIKSLLSAAEDGKVNALKKLVDIYEGEGAFSNPDAATQFTRQLADMGYPMYLIKTARTFLKAKDKVNAIRYLEQGIQANLPQAFFMLGALYLRSGTPEKRDEGITLLKRGSDLGDKTCIQKLEELAAAGDI